MKRREVVTQDGEKYHESNCRVKVELLLLKRGPVVNNEATSIPYSLRLILS